jgi:hypothetical protein
MDIHKSNNASATAPAGVTAAGIALRVGEVRDAGFYYVPPTALEQEAVVHFDGQNWKVPGAGIGPSTLVLTSDVVYGPLEFVEGILVPADVWPDEGDEFSVFVDVRDVDGSLAGFVLNPPPTLATMLREYGEDYPMAEEYFGQDFLPAQAGLYRMQLRMYVDPPYPIDGHEWADADPGLEVLGIERLTAEVMPPPSTQQ